MARKITATIKMREAEYHVLNTEAQTVTKYESDGPVGLFEASLSQDEKIVYFSTKKEYSIKISAKTDEVLFALESYTPKKGEKCITRTVTYSVIKYILYDSESMSFVPKQFHILKDLANMKAKQLFHTEGVFDVTVTEYVLKTIKIPVSVLYDLYMKGKDNDNA